MDFANIQNKIISAIASYFALDLVSKQLGNIPNLDAQKQGFIFSALGLFLPELMPKTNKKDDMQAQIIAEIADNMLFAGITILLPQFQQTAPPATNGYGPNYDWTANSYINGYGNNGNPLSVNQMINGVKVNSPNELVISDAEYLQKTIYLFGLCGLNI